MQKNKHSKKYNSFFHRFFIKKRQTTEEKNSKYINRGSMEELKFFPFVREGVLE